MLKIWLVIGMIEIVIVLLGALAFLALGIMALNNSDDAQQGGSTSEDIKAAGEASIITSVIYFVVCGE